MICPKCGANMTLKKGVCAKCGYDIEVSQKTRKYSCYYYNQGLAKAQIRDLSGAVDMLNRALKVSKKNVDARNLLGLIYFEMGEVALAIEEWIISKSYLEENNPATRYLQILQNNAAKVENYNVAIRKYNAAVELALQGGDDLALIQLKKAVQLNPRYVRAWQLLALLYMKHGENDRARRCLKRTLSIDIANTTSIGYLKEIRKIKRMGRQLQVTVTEPAEVNSETEEMKGEVKGSILPKFRYEEDKPDYRSFICLCVGLFVGIMFVFFLVIPSVKTGMREEFKLKQREFGEQQSGYLAELDALEKTNESLQSRLEMQELELEATKTELENAADKAGGVNVFRMVDYYLKLKRSGDTSRMNLFILQTRLRAISQQEMSNSFVKSIVERVESDYPDVYNVTMTSAELYEEGTNLYSKERFADALEYFICAYEKSPDNEKNLFYLARSYHMTRDYTNAKKYYTEYLERFPSGVYYYSVQEQLSWID
ncbi:MAG: tetratricopeptide repeat protein [Lachnospiraceae bacterium]|nr:tetratricopeptide repeat protein [Lachnospiraceae bacterium]MBR6999030.1 tetratricopeptide repeat protein [Lachnospiraceae bacterium]